MLQQLDDIYEEFNLHKRSTAALMNFAWRHRKRTEFDSIWAEMPSLCQVVEDAVEKLHAANAEVEVGAMTALTGYVRAAVCVARAAQAGRLPTRAEAIAAGDDVISESAGSLQTLLVDIEALDPDTLAEVLAIDDELAELHSLRANAVAALRAAIALPNLDTETLSLAVAGAMPGQKETLSQPLEFLTEYLVDAVLQAPRRK